MRRPLPFSVLLLLLSTVWLLFSFGGIVMKAGLLHHNRRKKNSLGLDSWKDRLCSNRINRSIFRNRYAISFSERSAILSARTTTFEVRKPCFTVVNQRAYPLNVMSNSALISVGDKLDNFIKLQNPMTPALSNTQGILKVLRHYCQNEPASRTYRRSLKLFIPSS